MGAINGFVVSSAVIFVFFMLGVHNFLTDFEDNGCEMTYMFEYPQYVKISLPQNITKLYNHYGLYAYGEGQFTEKLRHMLFNGVPVLFIPGNSGSHKQVRSLASVSLRKAISSHSRFHFDFFAVDFNEEYSALFGGVLQEQTNFVYHSIKKILSLYKQSSSAPTSVVIVGHSMGGVVARGLFVLPDFDYSLVKVIITLSTPHAAPVLSVDQHLANYYDAVNTHWSVKRSARLVNVTFISIGGGHRDLLVQSVLTNTADANVSILATAIPNVWVSTDHLCSMWCKQLVLVLVRALFDIVDPSTNQISENPILRQDVFFYHLVHRTAGKKFSAAEHIQQVTFNLDADWDEYLQRKLTISQPRGLYKTRFIMVRLVANENHHSLVAVAGNIEAKDWVFACSADAVWKSSRVCISGVNLSNETVFLPSANMKRKMVHIDLSKMKRETAFSHIVFRLLPSDNPVQLQLDVHSSQRHLNITLPHLVTFFRSVPVLQELTEENALNYKLHLSGLEKTWQAYLLHVVPSKCRYATHQAVATLHVPWSNEAVHTLITEKSIKPLKVKLQTPKPASFSGSDSVSINLVLDPSCRYSVRIQPVLVESLGQLVRFYVVQLPAYMAAVLLLVLRQQLLEISTAGSCSMFHSALAAGAKPYFLLPAAKIASRILMLPLPVLPFSFFHSPGSNLMQASGTDFFLLPLFLYMVAFAVVFILGILCWITIVFGGQAGHKMALRFLARSVTGMIALSDWVLSGLSHLPIAVAVALVALSFSTCGSLSMCVGLFFFFLLLCKMYEDYLEELLKISLHFIVRNLKKEFKKHKKDSVKEEVHVDNESKNIGNENSQDKLEEQVEDSTVKNAQGDNELVSETETDSSEVGELLKDDNSVTEVKNNHNQPKEIKTQNHPLLIKDEVVEQSDFDKVALDQLTADSREKYKGEETSSLTSLNFSFTLFIIWLLISMLNVPSVLVWAHNYRYSTVLYPDPSLIMGIILCINGGILWQVKIPRPNLNYYILVAHSLYVIAVLSICYGARSLHLLGPLLTTALTVVTLHQTCATTYS